jgi:hypothetical protein
MSYVCNTILTFGILEDEKSRLLEVNRFFRNKGFVSCDDEMLPAGWYGGGRMLETNICIGSFNYLDIGGLLGYLKEIKWEETENVQLILQNQDEVRFKIFDLSSIPTDQTTKDIREEFIKKFAEKGSDGNNYISDKYLEIADFFMAKFNERLQDLVDNGVEDEHCPMPNDFDNGFNSANKEWRTVIKEKMI